MEVVEEKQVPIPATMEIDEPVSVQDRKWLSHRIAPDISKVPHR